MQPGDLVPDFALPDQDGAEQRLSTLLADGPVVLFFYPAAMTAGCTKESCHFRDLEAEFAALGARVVGISADPVDKQAAFSVKHGFGYPLLADPDKTVAGLLGVGRGLLGLSPLKRTTFVIDADRRVLARIASEFKMDKHADQALDVLRARSSARR